jgi:chromosomal replication initiator protein
MEIGMRRGGMATVWPRHLAMYLVREMTPQSYAAIGRRFGGRDHSTVMHAVKMVKQRLIANENLLQDATALRSRLSAAGV